MCRYLHMKVPTGPKKWVRSPVAVLQGAVNHIYGDWEPIPSPQEEQQVLLMKVSHLSSQAK